MAMGTPVFVPQALHSRHSSAGPEACLRVFIQDVSHSLAGCASILEVYSDCRTIYVLVPVSPWWSLRSASVDSCAFGTGATRCIAWPTLADSNTHSLNISWTLVTNLKRRCPPPTLLHKL